MTDLFVIRNQLGHYWGKRKEWVDGSDARVVMRTKHRDDAANTLFELSSKDFELRGEVILAETDQRDEPIVEPSQIPLPVDPETKTEEETEAEPNTSESNPSTDEALEDNPGG